MGYVVPPTQNFGGIVPPLDYARAYYYYYYYRLCVNIVKQYTNYETVTSLFKLMNHQLLRMAPVTQIVTSYLVAANVLS